MSLILDPLQLSFSYLDSIDLYNCRSVCRDWASAIDTKLAKAVLAHSFQEQRVYSNRELVGVMQRFIDSASPNQKAKFTCVLREPPSLLGRAPECITLWVELKPKRGKFFADYDIKQDYVHLNWHRNGSLPRPLPREYIPRSDGLTIWGCSLPGILSKRQITYTHVPFEGVLVSSPPLPLVGDGLTLTDLEEKMVQIMQKRIDEFAEQRHRQMKCIIGSVAIPILMITGSFLLKSYFFN